MVNLCVTVTPMDESRLKNWLKLPVANAVRTAADPGDWGFVVNPAPYLPKTGDSAVTPIHSRRGVRSP